MMYVHSYIDRTGAVRHYFRKGGLPKVALPGIPGSAEFMKAYEAAVAGITAAARDMVPRPTEPAALAVVVQRYYASPKFANLSPSSKQQYRAILTPIVAEDGHRSVADMTPDDAERMITEIATTRGPGIANLTRSVLSNVYRYAMKLKIRKDNPFSSEVIEAYELGSHHTWTDEQLEQYRRRWPVGTRERLAFAVLLYSGQRVSDAVKLPRGVTNFTIKQQKTGVELVMPVHPAITRAAAALPENGIYLICDKDGYPIKPDTLSWIIREAVREAGLPPRCKAHGLRKANQRLLAERGATTKQMQAISGHRTLKETERYSEMANQASLAVAAQALLADEE